MARCTPGALVGSVRGKIGGLEFAWGSGGQVVRSKKCRTRGISEGQYNAGLVRANFETAWRSLSASDVAFYAGLARVYGGGRESGWSKPRTARDAAFRRWMVSIWLGGPGTTMGSLSIVPTGVFGNWVFPYQVTGPLVYAALHPSVSLTFGGTGYPADTQLCCVFHIARGLRFSGQAPRSLVWLGSHTLGSPFQWDFSGEYGAKYYSMNADEWLYWRVWLVHEEYMWPGNIMSGWTQVAP